MQAMHLTPLLPFALFGLVSSQEAPPPPPNDPICLSNGVCIQPNPELRVSALSPPGGPIDGSTQVVIIGDGFRDFGSLMRCRFGVQETPSSLTADPGEVVDPYNHTLMACSSPRALSPLPQVVGLEISLNGEDYSTAGRLFEYYEHPQLVAVSPSRGSAARPQTLTLTRSTTANSGPWNPGTLATQLTCRFEAVVQPDGKRQVPYRSETNASVVDDTELLCITPTVSFVAPVRWRRGAVVCPQCPAIACGSAELPPARALGRCTLRSR